MKLPGWLRRWHRRRIERRHARRLRDDYPRWIAAHDTLDAAVREALAQRLQALTHRPTIALHLAAADAPPAWLEATLASLREQIYPRWTLDREGDATAAADAEWTGCLQPGDVLAPHALLLFAEAAQRFPEAELLYCDHDHLDAQGRREDPHFKSDWNPELLLATPYLQPLALWRGQRVAAALAVVGAARPGPEQQHALLLQASAGLAASQVVHIPHLLVHVRRAVPAGCAAVQAHLQRHGRSARVEPDPLGGCSVSLAPAPRQPLVSLIVPTRDGLDLLRACVDGVLSRTAYPAFELLIVDNGSRQPPTLRYLQALAADPRVRVLRDERPFNFSALNNAAAVQARGEYLLLLNNDTEVIDAQWLGEMLGVADLPGVGAVGARLWYGDGSLQHAGLITGLEGVAGDAHRRLDASAPGHQGRAHLLQDFSAVTAACLLVRRDVYLALGGLDEQRFAVAYNDVDFCLRLRAAGHRIAWTPRAQLFHHESKSRGSDQAPQRRERFEREAAAMHARWGEALRRDPAYNPNLALSGGAFKLAWPPRVSLLRPWFDDQAS